MFKLTVVAGDGRVDLDWDPQPKAKKYRVRRRLIEATSFDNLTPQASSATSLTDTAVTNGFSYEYYAVALRADSSKLDESTHEIAKPQRPVAAQQGWAGLWNGTGVAGGTGGSVFVVDNAADFKAAVESTVSPRIVQVASSSVLDLGGMTVNVTTGRVTIEGMVHKSIKRMHLNVKVGDVILRRLRIRPGDDAALPDAAAAIMLNPGLGKTLSGVLIEHCSLAWAEDVCLNIFNGVYDVTAQYNLIGPSLYETPYKAGFNGYALSMHGDAAPDRHRRVSMIRNYIVHSYQRNLRCYAIEGGEYVNNVVYNWGAKAANANPVWANFVGNMAKKGPGSPDDNDFFTSQLFGDDNSYFADSVYWADNQMWDVNGSPLVPSNTFAPGVRYLAAPLNGPGVSGTLHNVDAKPATLGLAAEVVAAAGTLTPDMLEVEWKNDFTNGTWNGSRPDDWYRGPGVANPLIVPSW